MRRQKEEEDKAREELEVKRLRRQLVHKAKPILVSRPFEVKASTQPLTEPHSPFLLTKRRQRAQSVASNAAATSGNRNRMRDL